MIYLSILAVQGTRIFPVRKPFPGEVQQYSPIKNCIPKDKLWKE